MKLNLFSLRSYHLFLLLPLLCHEVAANTEIINFSSSRERTVDLPLDVVGNWSTLHPSENERQWTLEPAALHTPLHQVCEQTHDTVPPFSCPHELWLFLDLDDEKWASYSTFTLRLSWPASTPTDFTITTYAPQDLLARLSDQDLISTVSGRARTETRATPRTSSSSTPHAPTTRSRYARIRAVDAGVPTPGLRSYSPPLSPPPPPPPSLSLAPLPLPQPRVPVHHAGREAPASLAAEQGKGRVVPFVVVLEPSYLGVLPATLLPTVGFLIPIVLGAALCVPWVIAYFGPFVRQAREDVNASMTRTKKQR